MREIFIYFVLIGMFLGTGNSTGFLDFGPSIGDLVDGVISAKNGLGAVQKGGKIALGLTPDILKEAAEEKIIEKVMAENPEKSREQAKEESKVIKNKALKSLY